MSVWAEIDLSSLEDNFNRLEALSEKKVFGVVKDNAYGHGAVEVAKKLSDLGISMLCVFSLREAIELRVAGIKTDILIFAFTPSDKIVEAKDYNFIYTVPSLEWFKSIESIETPLRLHIEVNTGMNRIGFKDAVEIQKVLDSKHDVEGIYTHFANPENLEIGQQQAEKFKAILKDLNYPFKWVHLGNAPVEVIKGSTEVNASRFGLGMYGYRAGISGLKPVLSLFAEIEFIDKVYPGDTIGYDYTYEVTEEMSFGTIPIGYADGFDMRQALCPLIIDGSAHTVLGKVCMNQTMIQVDDSLTPGSVVELIGPHRNAEMIHEKCGIMVYVLVTCLNANIIRVYKDTSAQ